MTDAGNQAKSSVVMNGILEDLLETLGILIEKNQWLNQHFSENEMKRPSKLQVPAMYLSKALADAPFDFLAAGQQLGVFLGEALGKNWVLTYFAKRLNFLFWTALW